MKKITYLSPSSHQTILEVDLKAIRHNLRYFRKRLKSNTRMVAMVKAFAYGVGIARIAQVLEEEEIDYLAVAFADEGVALRKIDIGTPIMVFNPEPAGFNQIVTFNLEPEMYSLELFKAFINFLGSKENLQFRLPYPIHIKLDTGMHRLGFLEEDLDELIVLINQNKDKVRICSVFTHLAASDNEKHDDFTVAQIVRYGHMVTKLKEGIKLDFWQHILNTHGLERFPLAQMDMVRVGIGIFGISADAETQKNLLPVCTLKSRIAQIKKVKKGDSIGYSRKAIASQDMTIAIVFIGYADGLNRALSNGKGKLFVNGYFAPIVGNICMDITMIDISEIPAKVSDEVIIFGEPYSINDFAENLGTIPYEVLTDLSTRVRRVYIEN